MLEFNAKSGPLQFSAGRLVGTRSWSDYNDMCKIVNATLAAPVDANDFKAISTIASKKGHCFVGASRQDNGVDWKSPDGRQLSLKSFWAKDEPKDLNDFLCAYVFNDASNGAFLYAASCGGFNPVIKCYVCSRPAK